jgi:cell division protein ZapB
MYDISKGSGSFTYENRELFYSLKKEILIDKSVKSFSVEYQKNEDFTLGKHTITFYTNSYIIGKKEFLVK